MGTIQKSGFHQPCDISWKEGIIMFGFFKKAKSAKELDSIIAEINMNMQNNYKDAAQSALRELEKRFQEMLDAGALSEAQKSEYSVKISSYKERLKSYSHKDQKPYWTKE